MATNRRRRSRKRKVIPEDHWNLLLCRPLSNPWSEFYSDFLSRSKNEPTLREVWEANEDFIRAEWERTGKQPYDEDLQEWGIEV